MPAKLTKEEFVQRATQKYGNKYDYSKFEYVNLNTKGIIGCPKHGDFLQNPTAHLDPITTFGCRKCSIEFYGSNHRSTFLTFTKKANKKYNNKFDYSKFKYIDRLTKGTIICPKHGEFQQTPEMHLDKNAQFGCSKCAQESTNKKNSLSLKEFIKKSNKKHKNKYDYSKVIYVNNTTKIIIICPINNHGEFFQVAGAHMVGKGCPKCNKSKKLTREQFIKRASKKHNFKYDYSKTNFQTTRDYVIIICQEHGPFETIVHNHLHNNSGCPTCNSNKLTQEEFLQKAKEEHGNRYDYSKAIYINSATKIIIICSKHGEFKQTPNAHLSGKNCRKCIDDDKKLTKKEFIEKSNKLYKGKYDYSKFEYINCRTKGIIICSEHGEFLQNPNTHLQNKECPKCNHKGISKKETAFLNLLEIPANNRNVVIKTDDKTYNVDAKIGNIIVEFNGDFWHGNPEVFPSEKINKINKKSFGELYQKTIRKEQELKNLGYVVISVWEDDFRKNKEQTILAVKNAIQAISNAYAPK